MREGKGFRSFFLVKMLFFGFVSLGVLLVKLGALLMVLVG